jgi:hypothetical protein
MTGGLYPTILGFIGDDCGKSAYTGRRDVAEKIMEVITTIFTANRLILPITFNLLYISTNPFFTPWLFFGIQLA